MNVLEYRDYIHIEYMKQIAKTKEQIVKHYHTNKNPIWNTNKRSGACQLLPVLLSIDIFILLNGIKHNGSEDNLKIMSS